MTTLFNSSSDIKIVRHAQLIPHASNPSPIKPHDPSSALLTQTLAVQHFLHTEFHECHGNQHIESLIKNHIFYLPQEILLEYFKYLPATELNEARKTCTYFKAIIDSSHLLQTRIAHCYLSKIDQSTHILLDDLKYYLNNDHLYVEIKSDLSLIHLTQKLDRVIPWISHLTLHECTGLSLNPLIDKLRISKKLTSLHFQAAQIDKDSTDKILTLFKENEEQPRNSTVYLYNCSFEMTQDGFAEKIASLNRIKIISTPFTERNDEDFDALCQLDLHVSDPVVQAEEVIETYDSINPRSRSALVSSLWHSVLMTQLSSTTAISVSEIEKKVRHYIFTHPHHPAVMAAIADCHRDISS